MVVSDARREANRRNALKSTGPKTDEGKAKARQNALKHGLTSLVVVAEDAERFQTRADLFYTALRPQDFYQSWICEGAALITIKIDRVERIERKLREKEAWRASAFWDDDRRLEAERLGSTLVKDPSRVVGELRMTSAGCDWLIERWAMLAAIADLHPWTEAQKTLAFNMLGTPPEAREDAVGTLIDEVGSRLEAHRSEAEVARDAIAGLRLRRDRAAEADEIDQCLAQADLTEGTNPDLRRLRRYEGTLQRRLRWYLGEMDRKVNRPAPLGYFKPNYFNPPENCEKPDLETPIGSPPAPILEEAEAARSDADGFENLPTPPGFGETNPLCDKTKPLCDETKPLDESSDSPEAAEAEPTGTELNLSSFRMLDESEEAARGDIEWAELVRDRVEKQRLGSRKQAGCRRVLVES